LTVQTIQADQPVLRTKAWHSNRGFLISISGIDGSGKSSNAIALANGLRENGLAVSRSWTGYKHALSYPFLALLRLVGYTHRIKVRGLVFFKRDIRRNKVIARLWPIAIALDFVPKALVAVALPLYQGKIVVSDRYVYDVIAELTQDSNMSVRIRNVLLHLVPRPNIAFLMDVDENIAWERAMVPGRAPEQPYYDLGQRRRIYRDIARTNGIIVLDGSRDLSLNRKQILQMTLNAMKLQNPSC
jgi:thymidylate kinase